MPICWKALILLLTSVKDSEEPVTHLNVVSHEDYFNQDNHSRGSSPLQITSTLALRQGIQYLEDNHISYFKNAENIYKGGILKAYLPWLV